MGNNKSIGMCQNCGNWYCIECSVNTNWQMFCSSECEKEYNDEFKNLLSDNKERKK